MDMKKVSRTLDNLPMSLAETYRRIFEKIECGPYKEEARTILAWLCNSRRPLRLDELSATICIDLNASPLPRYDGDQQLSQPSDVLEICSSLVSTTLINKSSRTLQDYWINRDEHEDPRNAQKKRPGDIEVQLCHLSVKDYLQKSNTGTISDSIPSYYKISEQYAEQIIALVCTS